MAKELNHTFELPEKTNFNFMLDDGTVGYSGISVLGEHEYQFGFKNDYIVKSVYNPNTKTVNFYSNVDITDTGTNPKGIKILGLGDPHFFRTHLNL